MNNSEIAAGIAREWYGHAWWMQSSDVERLAASIRAALDEALGEEREAIAQNGARGLVRSRTRGSEGEAMNIQLNGMVVPTNSRDLKLAIEELKYRWHGYSELPAMLKALEKARKRA
jgi:hypothetical protein